MNTRFLGLQRGDVLCRWHGATQSRFVMYALAASVVVMLVGWAV